MKSKQSLNYYAIVMILVCILFILPHHLLAQEGEMPITTSSKEALKLFIEAREKFMNGESDAAADLFEKAIEKDADFALAYLFSAYCKRSLELREQDLEKAVSLVDKVSDGEKAFILFVKAWDEDGKDDRETEQKYLDQLLKLAPSDKWILHIAGNYYSNTIKDYDKAFHYFNKVIELDKNYAAIYNDMGFAYMAMEDYEEAEKTFQTYIKMLPDRPNPYNSYASLLRRLGRIDEAIENYNIAFEKDNRFVDAIRKAGHLYCLKGDYKAARENYQKVYSSAPTSILKISSLYWQAVTNIYENNLDEILKLYKEYQAIAEQEKLSDYRIWSYSDLGDIYTELDNPTEAMKYYKKAIDLIEKVELQDAVKETFVLNSLGWQAKALIAQNELEKAKEVLKKFEQKVTAKEDVAEEKNLNEVRARLAMAEGNDDTALEFLSKANESNPKVIYSMAVIHEKKGDKEKASELFEKLKNWTDNSIWLAFVRNKAGEKLIQSTK